MIIIAGHLVVAPENRDAYVAQSVQVVQAARAAPGCLDFSITSDSVDAGCIRIFERWNSEAELLHFRGSGPDDDQQARILDAEVRRYEISSVGDP